MNILHTIYNFIIKAYLIIIFGMKRMSYQPPKVKPSKKKETQPRPEWDSLINNLSKYKLSPAELVIEEF